MKKRDKRKRAKQRWQQRRRLEPWRRLEGVLDVLGLVGGFNRLPSFVRETIARTMPRSPKVVTDPASGGHPELEDLAARARDMLEDIDARSDDPRPVPLADFFSICRALPAVFRRADLRLSPPQRQFAEDAAARSEAFARERMETARTNLLLAMLICMLRASRLDQGVFACVLDRLPILPGRPVFGLTLSRHEPREARVEIDGHVRRAYRCGTPAWTKGGLWLECDGEALGLEQGRAYPFYLQSHALRRLRERLPAPAAHELDRNLGLVMSLAEPRLVERRGDDLWVEFRLVGRRIGYLLGRAVGGMVVFTTFLFLTMQGTPEHRLLYERLRLRRPDIEHLQLDRLETFLGPDVRGDEELAAILTEAGCGPLLELSRDWFKGEVSEGSAEELRRYLRLSEAPGEGMPRGLASSVGLAV